MSPASSNDPAVHLSLSDIAVDSHSHPTLIGTANIARSLLLHSSAVRQPSYYVLRKGPVGVMLEVGCPRVYPQRGNDSLRLVCAASLLLLQPK